jgi:hypothetical protein
MYFTMIYFGIYLILLKIERKDVIILADARMAELADALDSGSSELRLMGVQVPLRAIYKFLQINNL